MNYFTMKTLKYLMIFLFLGTLSLACSDNNEDPYVAPNPLEGYTLLSTVEANGHTLELYSLQGNLFTGYNALAFRLRNAEGVYVENPAVTWMPVMHMMDREHSCPKSALEPGEDPTVLKGFAVFQMPGNADEYWDITFNYSLGGESFSATERISVGLPADGMKQVNAFTGSDGVRYILAMMPLTPEVKVNDFAAVLFKMETMMSFPVVENYTVGIDPRMPGMGNHSSPNNENLGYDALSESYQGKLSLTMTGYWKINLQLFSATGEVLAGEEVTDTNEASSLYFELEF